MISRRFLSHPGLFPRPQSHRQKFCKQGSCRNETFAFHYEWRTPDQAPQDPQVHAAKPKHFNISNTSTFSDPRFLKPGYPQALGHWVLQLLAQEAAALRYIQKESQMMQHQFEKLRVIHDFRLRRSRTWDGYDTVCRWCWDWKLMRSQYRKGLVCFATFWLVMLLSGIKPMLSFVVQIFRRARLGGKTLVCGLGMKDWLKVWTKRSSLLQRWKEHPCGANFFATLYVRMIAFEIFTEASIWLLLYL